MAAAPEVFYREGEVVSVKGDWAWVLVDDGGKSETLKMRIADYVELPDGEYKLGCDWDPNEEETPVGDSTPDGGQTVELRKRGKQDWQVHKKKGHGIKTFTYSMPEITSKKVTPYHHDIRLVIRWGFAYLGEARDEKTEYQVTAGGQVVLSGEIPAGKKLSTKKRVKKNVWVPPNQVIKASFNALHGDKTNGTGGIKIGFTV